jgi:hypothetical protein
MSTPAKLLYLHLALAADRRGLSFWGDRRIQHLLDLEADELDRVRKQLMGLYLLAFDGRTYQLLSLPDRTPPTSTSESEPTPASDDSTTEIPEEARRILRRFLGHDFPG